MPGLKAQLMSLLDDAAARAAAADPEHRPAAAHHQGHLLRYFDAQDATGQERLAQQIGALFAPGCVGVTNVFFESKAMSTAAPRSMEPPAAADGTDFTTLTPERSAALRAAGLGLIKRGAAAVVVLAGGSGTRLGVSFPKGMLRCPELLAPKSLFQLQCEKVRRAEVAAGAAAGSLPLCLMTSPQTDATTRRFFADNGHFCLRASQVHFFQQSTMPCFDEDGRIMLADAATIAQAPGGNAGIYQAFADSGLLKRLGDQGVECCQVVTVDNLLTQLADPAFFGLYAESGGRLEVAVKAVRKARDAEAVGVFARRGYPNLDPGLLRWGVVEYTEIGEALAAKVDPATGRRMYDAGNIAVHLFAMSFMRKAAEAMKTFTYYHVARKPIPTRVPADRVAVATDPTVPMLLDAPAPRPGVKLEAFIFDLFQLVSEQPGAFALVTVDRATEFSAIKNADSADASGAVVKDSPATAVADLHRLHAGWVAAAGVAVPAGLAVEISPLVAVCPDDVVALVPRAPLEGALQDATRGVVVELNGDAVAFRQL